MPEGLRPGGGPAAGAAVFYWIAAPEVVAVLGSGEELLALSGHLIELCPNYRAPEA